MPEQKPSEDPHELPPTGEVSVAALGRYRILGELGRGGCGVVYRALDPSIGRVVAIKTILAKTESSAGEDLRERFRREARSAGALSHPNIVTVHDFSDSGDPMFIAMEFVEGRTLAERMHDGPLSTGFVLGVLRAAADALDYAHSHRIVHRDVKPANFLITKSGLLKITDFGIAKMLDSEEGLTSTGVVVGTAQYMSPEQISETHITGRSDQFSLAVIAYEMLTGVKPFQGNSWASVIHAIIMAEPPHIAKYRDSLGETVNIVLRKALSKDPESRYQTCTEFFGELERAVLGATVERTAIYAKPPVTTSSGPASPIEPEKTRISEAPPRFASSAGTAPQPVSATVREETPPPEKAAILKPILIGGITAAVIGGGVWFGLASHKNRSTTPPLVAVVSERPAAPIPQPPEHVSQPAVDATPAPASVPVQQAPPRKAKETSKPVREIRPAETERAPPPQPAPVSKNPVSPTLEIPPPVVTPPAAPVIHEAIPALPPPVSVAKKTQDDQAKRAADDQAKRLQAEQAKRAVDEQAKRLADQQASSAHVADLAAISNALREYQSSYERRDPAALEAIWPSIPKQVIEGVRSSFRDASEVSMGLRPLAEPKIAGSTATVICDRSLRQVILKRTLQASGQVRIVLNRSSAGWVIQSVVPVSK